MEKIKRRQRLLSVLRDETGGTYYDGPIDGIDGPGTQAGAERFLKDYGFTVDQVQNQTPEVSTELPDNAVLAFSLAADGDKKLSEHFRVREFACNDGTDPVFIHPILPVWAEMARAINGPFRPNSAYRTVAYNASPQVGGAKLSLHCRGLAMDIPKSDATPEELYALFEEIMGDSGGLGIYNWGVHVDPRPVKSRWDERSK